MIDVFEKTKNALREGRLPKNYRFIILNSDNAEVLTIDNDNLVTESVELDEKLCSDSTLKFGLCEGSCLKFQYFGLSDITGMRIKAFIDVMAEDATIQSIPMGFYKVDKCIKDQSTSRYRVVSYNKLKASELSVDATEIIKDIQDDNSDIGKITLASVESFALGIPHKALITELSHSVISNMYTNVVFKTIGSSDNYYLWFEYLNAETSRGLERYFIEVDCKEYESYLGDLWATFRRQSLYSDILANYSKFWSDFESDPTFGLGNLMGLIDGAFLISYSPLDTPTTQYQYNRVIKPKITVADVGQLWFGIPIGLYGSKIQGSRQKDITIADLSSEGIANAREILNTVTVQLYLITDIEKKRIDKEKVSNITFRDLYSSIFELNASFGYMDRETDRLFSKHLEKDALLPDNFLYPSDGLHPEGASETAHKALYSSLAVGEKNKYRKLLIEYKTLNETQEEQTASYQITVGLGKVDYVIDNNWVLSNIIWTEEDIANIAIAIRSEIQGLEWIEFDCDSTGLPYLETGDMIEIETNQGSFHSYILERNLKGIQNLSDNFNFGTVETF